MAMEAKLREAYQQMDRLRTLTFQENKKVTLVFPGLKSACRNIRHPPPEFDYRPREVYPEVAAAVVAAYNSGDPGFVLTGPRGGGKSSLLRALAVQILLATPAAEVRSRTVCFWCLDAAKPLAAQVRDAFLFAFYAEGSEVVEEIGGMESWEDAVKFIRGRKENGEKIHLIVDEVGSGNVWVEKISAEANFVIRVLNPDANQVQSPTIHTYHLNSMLNKSERASFVDGTILSTTNPHHQMVVDDLAGGHPLSLSTLIAYFERKISKRTVNDSSTQKQNPSRNLWSDVVDSFRQSSIFEKIRESVREAKIERGTISSLYDLTLRFPLYALKSSFCSPFIKKIYIEEVIARGLLCARVWLDYLSYRLQCSMNRLEADWLSATYISHWMAQGRTLKVAEDVFLRNLRVVVMTGSEPAPPPISMFDDGAGVLMVPDKYFCRKDFVVLRKVGSEFEIYEGKLGARRAPEQTFMDESRIKNWLGEDAAVCVRHIYFCPNEGVPMSEVENATLLTITEGFQGIEMEEAKLIEKLLEKRENFENLSPVSL